MIRRKYAVRSPESRFWTKVNKNGPIPECRPDLGPCWLWTASLLRGAGYGRFRYETAGDYAHRAAYLFCVGSIPDRYDIDHLCRNRACVNFGHLEAVPHQVNALRGNGCFAQASRGEWAGRGTLDAVQRGITCRQGHDIWRFEPEGRPYCVECNRLYQRRRYQPRSGSVA